MKNLFLFIIASSLSVGALAETVRSKISSIDPGQGQEETLVKLENGRVIFVKGEDKEMFKNKSMINTDVEIEADEEGTLESIQSVPAEDEPEQPEAPTSMSVEPTVLPSPAAASDIFRGMNRSYYSKTECTDRAQIWAYEEWKKKALISKKVFLFFTNTYIRRYRYHWWFHVSPYVMVNNGEAAPVERVMDRRYTSGPRMMKTWTDVFIRSKQTCAESTYRHYRSNRNGPAHCFIVKSDMYYRLPLHVRNLEDSGIVKTQWSMSEINFSYRAFRRRGAK